MTYEVVNLLPRSIHAQRVRNRSIRRWSFAATGCLLAALLAIGLGGDNPAQADSSALQARLDAAVRQRDQLVQQIASAKQTTQSLRRDLASVQQVADQPDLELLLRLVGQQLGTEAMLTRCRIGTGEEADIQAAIGRDVSRPGQRWLVLSGIAADHQAVPAIVLRLEQLGLFDQIIMNETWSESYLGQPRIGFRIACLIPVSET